MNDDKPNDAEKKLPPLHPTYEALRKMRPAAAASDDESVKEALAAAAGRILRRAS